MFGSNKQANSLDVPPIASKNSEAKEILRVWVVPNGPTQVVLRANWSDPGAWGLLLVDVARHAAQAYRREGKDESAALARIRELAEAEWSSPTDSPEDLTDRK